jgi:hypothetical protein
MTSPEVTSTTEKNSPPSTQSEPGALSFADYEKFRRGDLKLDGDATKSAPESKPTQEQKVAANSESAESEEDEIDESDESDKDADDSDKSKPKKKSGYQRRIDKLNARHKAAQDELEYWKSQALKTGQAEPKQEQKVDRKADGKPNPESFETHSEYVEALTDWKLDQKEASRRAEEEKSKVLSEQEKLYKAHLEREKSFIDISRNRKWLTPYLPRASSLKNAHAVQKRHGLFPLTWISPIQGLRQEGRQDRHFEKIRKPNRFTTTSGANYSAQDVTEDYFTLTVDTQQHVDFEFISSDLTLSVDEFSERYPSPPRLLS